MATKPVKEPESAQAKSLLKKRVNIAKDGALSRDVKTPKWIRAIGGYFAGSWHELREVRWPTRRATWSLTSAVILFTLVLTAFILALDFGFEQLFKKVIL